MCDRATGQAEGDELLARDDAMLPTREREDALIEVLVP
jgi:hypothetical protein